MEKILPSVKILGTSITVAPKEEILEFIIMGLKKKSKKFYIVTPNPEILVYASASSSYQKILNDAQVALPDGIGILAAGNILKKGVKERITGVDLMMDIVGKCAEEGLSIGLLGGSKGVAEKTAECLIKKHPNLRVSFIGHEWQDLQTGPADGVLSSLPLADVERGHVKEQKVVSSKQQAAKNGFPHSPSYSLHTTSHIDILFVAFGFPKQEEWIAANLDKIPATAAMGVGGAFDYISGKVNRAPKFVRSAGFEWAFRLVVQPWRIKRQLALPKFAFMVLKERFVSTKR